MDERGLTEVGSVPHEPAGGTYPGTQEKGREQAPKAAGSAKDVAATASGEARQVAGTAAEGARDVARETGRQVGEVAGEAAAQARDMLAQTTGQLKEQASAQTGRAAEGLRTVTSQLQALSDGRPAEAGAVGDYARQMTTKLDELAGRLDERGFDGMMDDVQRFARRRPGVFLLGAVTAGFFAGRFLRGAQAAPSPDQAAPAPARVGTAFGTTDLEPGQLVDPPPEAGELVADVPIDTVGGRATGTV